MRRRRSYCGARGAGGGGGGERTSGGAGGPGRDRPERLSGRRQPVRVLLPELRHLGRNDRLAVPLVRVPVEIVLVVRLGGIEDLRGAALGHDRVREDRVRLQVGAAEVFY